MCALTLSVGSYVNNYQCGGGDCAGGVGSPQYNKVMNSTVQWLKQKGFKYLKVDSGGCYNDMELWHELLVAADWDITVENCHQGGQPPNATWCPFDLWRVGPDVNGIGPDNEIARVIAALNGMFTPVLPRSGFFWHLLQIGKTRCSLWRRHISPCGLQTVPRFYELLEQCCRDSEPVRHIRNYGNTHDHVFRHPR